MMRRIWIACSLERALRCLDGAWRCDRGCSLSAAKDDIEVIALNVAVIAVAHDMLPLEDTGAETSDNS